MRPRSILRTSPSSLLATLLLAALVLPGCVAGPERPLARQPAAAAARPRVRTSGPRLPTASGVDPATRGWQKVADLLWVEASEAPLWERVARGDASAAPSAGLFVLRTDHVSVRTDVPPVESVQIARLAESHVRALFDAFGEALDLRLPYEPLRVRVHARRASFRQALDAAAPGHPGWGAFYDARTGEVHVSLQGAPQAALPMHADLRHEMTHQVLDLSTPALGRARIFQGLYLWLWEGFAAWTETLGDRPGEDSSALRRQRFAHRRTRQEVAPLATLFRLDQTLFEGRHYDQSAVLLAWLMRDGTPRGRGAVLATLAALLRGTARPEDFERRVGMNAVALDAAWRRGW